MQKKEPDKQAELIEKLLSTDKQERLPKPLNTRYKVDFVLQRVVIGNKWVQLPENYDILNKSYNQMVEDNSPNNN